MNVDVKAIVSGVVQDSSLDKFEKRETFSHGKALNYLKAKFPDVDEIVFFTDYTGQIYDNVISF